MSCGGNCSCQKLDKSIPMSLKVPTGTSIIFRDHVVIIPGMFTMTNIFNVPDGRYKTNSKGFLEPISQ